MVLILLALLFAGLAVVGSIGLAGRRAVAALAGGAALLPGALGLGATAAEMARRWAGAPEAALPWLAGVVTVMAGIAAVLLIIPAAERRPAAGIRDQGSGIRDQGRRVAMPLAVIVLIPVLCLLVPAVAWADESTRIDLTPLLTWVVEIAVAVLGVLGAWAVRRLSAWLRLAEDSRVRQYLDDAMARGLAYARELALQAGQDLARPDVRSELVARAAAYVLPKVPDALARFGISPECLAERLTARLPDVAWDPSLAAPAATGAGTGTHDEDIPL